MKTIDYQGKVYMLLQDAFLDWDSVRGQHYSACAMDNGGQPFVVKWEITNELAENEEDCCDWNNYYVVEG